VQVRFVVWRAPVPLHRDVKIDHERHLLCVCAENFEKRRKTTAACGDGFMRPTTSEGERQCRVLMNKASENSRNQETDRMQPAQETAHTASRHASTHINTHAPG
jgi:hypothetical protein